MSTTSTNARDAADVSVVIPLYNHRAYIGPAIDSVLRQTVAVREILCIDDGSTDGSGEVVQRLARTDPRIRFWSRPNRGAHATLNEGIAAARGSTIAILNSDDLYAPDRLRRCCAVLEAEPAIKAVFSAIRFIDGAGAPLVNDWYERARQRFFREGDLEAALLNGNFLLTTSNLVVRRSVFDEVGRFDDLRYAHDLDFFLRLLSASVRLTILQQPLLAYRMHGSNTISESHEKVRLEVAAIAAFHLRRVSLGRSPERKASILRTLEQHQLLRPTTLALRRLEAQSGGPASPGQLLADPRVRADLLEAAR